MRRFAVFRPTDLWTCALITGAFIGVLRSPLSYAQTFNVTVMRAAKDDLAPSASRLAPLRGIHWAASTAPVSGSDLNPLVRLQGTYLPSNWTLAFDFKDATGAVKSRTLLYPRVKDGEQEVTNAQGARPFEVELPIFGKNTSLRLWAKGPKGQLEELRLVVVFNDWETFEDERVELRARPVDSPSRFSLTPSLGAVSFSFQQEGIASYSDTALIGGLSIKAWIVRSRWSFEVAGDTSLGALTAQPSSATMRRLQAKARIGYVLPSARMPWRIVLGGGARYFTSVVPGNEFGYKRMLGPEVSAALTRSISRYSVLGASARFAPISIGVAFPKAANWGLGFRVSWGWKAEKSQHRRWRSVDLSDWRLSVDYSALRIETPASSMRSQTTTLGLSYSW